MGWRIVAVSEVPLGRRTLRRGTKGKDVDQLQRLLTLSGFYFGPIDGAFGILTEEAVLLFQSAFNLRVDGIAGPELLKALQTATLKQNRVIYTVKPKDNLKTISRKFGVAPSAWRSIPGQGNPQRKIYPGMKLLLNQKAVICSGRRATDFPVTAFLEAVWELADDGGLIRINKNEGKDSYQSVIAKSEAWGKILLSPNHWEKLGANLKRECGCRWGIDFRNAPLETIIRWSDFLDYLCKTFSIKQIPMIIIPLLENEKTIESKLYWLNIPRIGNLAKLILIEPQVDLDSPSDFLKSNIHLERILHKLTYYGFGSKALLMGSAGGWDWNMEQAQPCRPVSFREGKIWAAMNHRSVKYDRDTTYTIVDFKRRRERHWIIFRDQQGWLDWVNIGLKSKLLGFVIHNPKDLGKFGSELINGSFRVLSEEKL